MCDFNHLHCHTRFSLLDGAANIKLLTQKAKELGMAGVVITDHGNLYGVPEFYTEIQKAGVALRNATRALEKAEEIHPIGYFNTLARRVMEERAENLRYDPRGPQIGND